VVTPDAHTRFPVDAVLTRGELADWLKVPVATTYRLEGIPCRRVGREYRFPVGAVLRWLEGDDESADTPAQLERRAPGQVVGPRPGVRDAAQRSEGRS
jgi:hypothetical protein